MECEKCAGRLREGMLKVSGVTSAEVDFAAKRLTVSYDATKTDGKRLAKEAEDLGFKVKEEG
jgi:copper chaperone CopZ